MWMASGIVVGVASSYGVYYGGGATKATGFYCQFSEGDSRLCGWVHRSARRAGCTPSGLPIWPSPAPTRRFVQSPIGSRTRGRPAGTLESCAG
jgi:hypothetical protein